MFTDSPFASATLISDPVAPPASTATAAEPDGTPPISLKDIPMDELRLAMFYVLAGPVVHSRWENKNIKVPSCHSTVLSC